MWQVEDHEKRIRELENTLKTHAKLLGTHGQILEEHGERLHIREEIADQHSISILNLQVIYVCRIWKASLFLRCASMCAIGLVYAGSQLKR